MTTYTSLSASVYEPPSQDPPPAPTNEMVSLRGREGERIGFLLPGERRGFLLCISVATLFKQNRYIQNLTILNS